MFLFDIVNPLTVAEAKGLAQASTSANTPQAQAAAKALQAGILKTKEQYPGLDAAFPAAVIKEIQPDGTVVVHSGNGTASITRLMALGGGAQFKVVPDSNPINEFAPGNGDDGSDEDGLFHYAKMWYSAPDVATQRQVEQALAKAGWEIGELESEEGGAFVVRAGDENGDSYIGWSEEQLADIGEGLAEMDKSQKGPAGWNIDDDEPGGKEYYGKVANPKDVVKQGTKALDNAFNSQQTKDTPKKTDEGNYDDNRTGFRKPSRDLSDEGEPHGVFTVMIDGKPWKTATSNEAFRMAKNVATKYPTKQVQVKWPNGALNTIKEDSSDFMANDSASAVGGKVTEAPRMSAAMKLQRAFQREQEKSAASRKRGEEVMAQAKADFEKKSQEKQVNELSPATLKSYARANVDDQVQRASSDSFKSGAKGDKYNKADVTHKDTMRQQGMDRALNKLSKATESVDYLAKLREERSRKVNSLVNELKASIK